MTEHPEAAESQPSAHSHSSIAEKDPFVGRDKELAHIDAILDAAQPGFVVVAGETGMGKTRLLRKVQTRAIERGWRVLPKNAEQELAIDTRVTEEIFGNRVRDLLHVYDGNAIYQTARTLDRSRRNLHPLVEQLRRMAPVLLLIDGYQPEAAFSTWFSDRFIADIKQAEARVVIVVADRARNVNTLSSLADVTISLGSLDSVSIRHLLEDIGRDMVPPMKVAELNEYVTELCRRPEMLGHLKTVLLLAKPKGL